KQARLERAAGIDAAFKQFVTQKLDALAGLRPVLLDYVDKLPGARLLDGRFTVVEQSIGTPRGREAGARYLRDFVEDAKASGYVAQSIARNGVRGLTVAPRAEGAYKLEMGGSM